MPIRRGNMFYLLAGVHILAGLACGGGADVFRISSLPHSGIAYFPLVPVNKEVIRHAQVWARVRVVVKAYVKLANEWSVQTDTYLFSTACEKLHGTVAERVTKLTNDVATAAHGPAKPPDALEAVEKVLAGYSSCVADPALPSLGEGAHLPAVLELPIVSRERMIVRLPATRPEYLNVWTPRGGTANADVHLSEQGTLTQATAQRQDQLPGALATLAGTLGAAGLGGLATVVTARISAAGAAATEAIAPSTSRMMLSIQPEPARRAGIDRALASVEVEVETMRRIYAVTYLWDVELTRKVGSRSTQNRRSTQNGTQTAIDKSKNPCPANPAAAIDKSKNPRPANPAACSVSVVLEPALPAGKPSGSAQREGGKK